MKPLSILLLTSFLLSACMATTESDKPTAPRLWPDFMPTLLPAISESPSVADLPASISITPPAASLAPKRSSWSGIWSGWGGRGRTVDIRLAVEEVTENQATIVVVRTISSHPRLEHRAVAKFESDELVATLPSGTEMRYRMREQNIVEFVWHGKNGGWMAGVMSRSDPDSTMEKVRIPGAAQSDGKPVTLEAIVYRPTGPGPFPTVLFNHGSTGIGNNPALFRETAVEPVVASWFTQRGWMVVFPQRRGRGKSDGHYAEGLEPDGSGYSIRPELALPGVDHALTDIDSVLAWLRQQKDVQSDQLVIAGQSRGGALAIVHAGENPDVFIGAINFVGGWMNDQRAQTRAINKTVFERGAGFKHPTLWLYADQDPFYGIEHSRSNFEAFTQAGGTGEFHVVPVQPGQNGHAIASVEALWSEPLSAYLKLITP